MMNTGNAKTPSQIAEEAKETGLDAVDSAKNFAQASKGVAADAANSVKASAEEARELGRDAASAAGSYAQQAKQTGRDALETGRAYAKGAADAAGQKVAELKERLGTVRVQGERYVIDQPVRSALMAAAGGAALTALLLAFMRGGRR